MSIVILSATLPFGGILTLVNQQKEQESEEMREAASGADDEEHEEYPCKQRLVRAAGSSQLQLGITRPDLDSSSDHENFTARIYSMVMRPAMTATSGCDLELLAAD